MVAFKYRVRLPDGEYVGGPMYYLSRILKFKWLALIFAVGTVLMALTAGSALQSNSIADALREGYNLNPWYVGLFIAIAAGVVIIGGVKRIAAYSEWLVPIMGGLYLLLSLIVLCMHLTEIPSALLMIIKSAFTGKAAVGGAAGIGIMAIVQAMVPALSAGVTRAVLATEAGLEVLYCGRRGQNPQCNANGDYFGYVCILGDFYLLADGYGYCTGRRLANPNVYAANLCNSAFKTVPYIGTPILIFSLVIFSFTTIIGWGYYVEKALQFLCKGSNMLIKPVRVLFIILTFVGGWIGTSFRWIGRFPTPYYAPPRPTVPPALCGRWLSLR